MALNQKTFEAFGLLKLSTDLSNSLPQSATKKGKNSANKKSNSQDSDSSEYLLGDDDQGDSDDDDTESDEVPEPLEMQVLLLSSKYWMGNVCIAFGCLKSII